MSEQRATYGNVHAHGRQHDNHDEPGTTKNRRYFGYRSADVLALCENQRVELVATDGHTYKAVLVGSDTYDLILQLEDNSLMLFAKGAMKYLRPATPAKAVPNGGV